MEAAESEAGQIGALADGEEKGSRHGGAIVPSGSTAARASGGGGRRREGDREVEILDAAAGGVLEPAFDVGIVAAAGREGEGERVDPEGAVAEGEASVDGGDELVGGIGKRSGGGGELQGGGVGPAEAPEAAPAGREGASADGVLEREEGEDVETDGIWELGEEIVASVVGFGGGRGRGGGDGGGGRGGRAEREVGSPTGFLLLVPHEDLVWLSEKATRLVLLFFSSSSTALELLAVSSTCFANCCFPFAFWFGLLIRTEGRATLCCAVLCCAAAALPINYES